MSLTPTLLSLVIGVFAVAVGVVLASRAKNRRSRLRRVLAIHLRLEEEWSSARMRMYLAGPVGPIGVSRMTGTKYSNNSTKPDLVRYIGG
jgi:hypothetical protein